MTSHKCPCNYPVWTWDLNHINSLTRSQKLASNTTVCEWHHLINYPWEKFCDFTDWKRPTLMILSEGWAERVIQLSHSGLSNFTACLIHTSQPHTCRGHSALKGIRVQRTKVDSKVKLRVWKYIVWILWGMISLLQNYKFNYICVWEVWWKEGKGHRERRREGENGKGEGRGGEGGKRDGWGITFTWILHLSCSKHVGEFPPSLPSPPHIH